MLVNLGSATVLPPDTLNPKRTFTGLRLLSPSPVRPRSAIPPPSARVHTAAGLPDPVANEPVRLAKRQVARELGTRQDQARGLIWTEIAQYLAIASEFLRDDRDRSLVCVAYDAMCRSEELVALDLEHVAFDADGSATVLIEASKRTRKGRAPPSGSRRAPCASSRLGLSAPASTRARSSGA